MLKLKFLSSRIRQPLFSALRLHQQVFSRAYTKGETDITKCFSFFGRRRLGGRIITSRRITLDCGAVMRLGGILVDAVDEVPGHEDVNVHQLGNPGVIAREW